MKKYIVGYLSFFENELILDSVEAESDFEAAKKFLVSICITEESKKEELDYQNSDSFPKTLEELKDLWFDTDAVINVKEL